LLISYRSEKIAFFVIFALFDMSPRPPRLVLVYFNNSYCDVTTQTSLSRLKVSHPKYIHTYKEGYI
jgi:hypothetical protein